MDVSRILEDYSSDSAIPPIRLTLALLCPLFVVLFSAYYSLNLERQLVVSVIRTIVQLLLAGYILLGFIFSIKSPIAVIAYLVCMGLIASLEVTSRQVRTYNGHFTDSMLAVLAGGGVIGAYGSIVIFNPDPWWNPHVRFYWDNMSSHLALNIHFLLSIGNDPYSRHADR